MSQHGATLQGLNNEMVSCVETLRRKREETHEQILKEQVSVRERGKRERESERRTIYSSGAYILLRPVPVLHLYFKETETKKKICHV